MTTDINMVSDYSKAKEKLLAVQDLSCRKFFLENGYLLEYAYCELLDDNLEIAKEIFYSLREKDVRAHWGYILISFIEGQVTEYPTYFEIRNFLEIDLNILIKYFKGDYVEKILRYSDFMFSVNPEVYKFIGRVLYNNNMEIQAMYFLENAKSYFYHDPELHFLIAYIYYNKNDFQKSEKSLQDCLYVLPKYYPAVALLKKIGV